MLNSPPTLEDRAHKYNLSEAEGMLKIKKTNATAYAIVNFI